MSSENMDPLERLSLMSILAKVVEKQEELSIKMELILQHVEKQSKCMEVEIDSGNTTSN